MKADNLTADLPCRHRVSEFVEEHSYRNENKKRDLTREPPIKRRQFIVGEGAPILDRRPNRADAEEGVEEGEEVEELHGIQVDG